MVDATAIHATGSESVTGAKTFSASPTLSDVDVVLGTATGTKIGTATTQKLAFFNATPVVQPSAVTQTYSTADATLATPTAVAVATTASTSTLPFGYTQAQADAIVANLNALRLDVLDLAQFVNSVTDKLQALGLVG